MTDVRVEGPAVERGEEILTPAALDFVADLQRRFGAHRDALLAARAEPPVQVGDERHGLVGQDLGHGPRLPSKR